MLVLLAVVVGFVLWSGPVAAIRWEFDDGTTQGWSAKEAGIWGGVRELHLFPGEVEDGVWRIAVDPAVTKGSYSVPIVEVVSPTIGYDSSLFDQVRIRCRTVHHRPTVGIFVMEWTNEHNALSSSWDPEDPSSGSRFTTSVQEIVYTTEWQELVLSLEDQDETIWEGLLKDIQLSFHFHIEPTEPTQSASDVVAWFEIDWIELTGVEELLQGELPPPPVEYFGFEGGVFASPVFYPIAPGIGGESGARTGVLTDLDGDGALDLFAVWRALRKYRDQLGDLGDKVGWLIALNDGHGGLELKRVEEVAAAGQSITDAATDGFSVSGVALEVLGADLTGDGRDEIAMDVSNAGSAVEVWSIEEDLQIEMLVQIENRWLGDVADWDGDGTAELFVGSSSLEGSMLEVWEVEQGAWTAEVVATAERHVSYQIGDWTGTGALSVLWGPIAGRAHTWIVRPLDDEFQTGESFEFDEGKRLLWKDLLGVGDFDGDGQADFLTGFIRDQVEGLKGLALQSKRVGDRLETDMLYDARLFVRSPVLIRDLNADGIDDWVFIGGDRASGFGVFVEWGGSINPTQAGERHRLTGSGTHVLSGDMDGDGDLDLVVLDPILGGVHVLKSSLSAPATAVLASTATRPAQYRLGDSYPNPFNPAVVIPLDLAKDAEAVSLRVHDMLGRRVRQLWQGPLGAGSHRFVWDGRDEAGKAVAAGVYVYRVEVDGRTEAKKTTKLP